MGNKRFGKKRHFIPTKQQLIRTTLDCVRPVYLDIWRVE